MRYFYLLIYAVYWLLALDDAVDYRAVFVIVSGSDGRAETILEVDK